MVTIIRLLFCVLLLGAAFFAPSVSASPADSFYIRNGTITQDGTLHPDCDLKKVSPADDWYSQYTDYTNGFSMYFPRHMLVDVTYTPVRTVLADENTSIEIYYDSFYGTISSSRDYLVYSNNFTSNTRDHNVEYDKTLYINGYKVHLLKWTRRQLSKITNDKYHYVSAEFVKNNMEVYTVLIKSSRPITDEMVLVNSFNIFTPQGTVQMHKPYKESKTIMNSATKAFWQKNFSADSPLQWGIFEPYAPDDMTSLKALEENLHYSFKFLLRYHDFEEKLPMLALEQAHSQHKTVELTLQTLLPGPANALLSKGYAPNSSIVYDVLDGHYDEYLNEYARDIKAFGQPVLFRLNNEMNGDWCWYSAYYTSKDAELYRKLWIHIYSIFAANQVDNVLWVWNPHDVSRPDFKWNHFLNYYPGDEYVDIIGLTGYNTGTYFPGEEWRNFNSIYQNLYQEYSELFPKPFMITEFSCNSIGGDKPAWIHDMFSNIKSLPNIKVAIWWSGIDFDTKNKPGRIYLIDENEAVLDVFRQRLPEFYNNVN